MTKEEMEELKEMGDKLFKEMKNREFVPHCLGTGRSWTIVNKVDKQKSKIYRKFTSARLGERPLL